MREDAFRAFLTASSYTSGSVASRLSRCRSVERRLRIDLDRVALDPMGIADLKRARVRDGLVEPMLASHLNAVRTYAWFSDGQTFPSVPPDIVEERPEVRRLLVPGASTPELMRLYADVLTELRSRGVVRTANGPVGDYAELLIARAFHLTLSSNSAAGYDARGDDGRRYQVKGATRRREAGQPPAGSFPAPARSML